MSVKPAVLQVSAEMFPLLKTGGLADVAGALPVALQQAGADVRVLLPGFAPVLADLEHAVLVADVVSPWGSTSHLRFGRLRSSGLPAYVLDAPHYYQREGSPYEDAKRRAHADNHRRFALLGWVGAKLSHGLDNTWQPNIVHSHDWHAALTPAYASFAGAAGAAPVQVYTIHNLAYQGLFSRAQFVELGLPAKAFAIQGLEFHDQMSFMKAGLFYADHLTTVSPSYAQEIQTPEQGCGLDGLLRERSACLTGILNGVDETVWDPAQDPAIVATYHAQRPQGKTRCKAALQARMGLAVQPNALLFGIVSRLTEQKGLQLVLSAVDDLLAWGGQLVVLGSGDPALEQAWRQLAIDHPGAVAVHVGYDEDLAHQVFAGTDVTLVPSRFEPCGLTQMYGLKYGSLPLVHRVGGLADTVEDCSLENLDSGRANGFVFHPFQVNALRRAIERAFALYKRSAQWRAVRSGAMRQPLGWEAAASQYMALYRSLLAK